MNNEEETGDFLKSPKTISAKRLICSKATFVNIRSTSLKERPRACSITNPINDKLLKLDVMLGSERIFCAYFTATFSCFPRPKGAEVKTDVDKLPANTLPSCLTHIAL